MTIICPRCPVAVEVSEEDPDASLADLWWHLYRHAPNHDDRTRLFIQAQQAAR